MYTHVVSSFIQDPNIFRYLVTNMGDLIFPIQVLVYLNTKVLDASLLLNIKNIYRSNFLNW